MLAPFELVALERLLELSARLDDLGQKDGRYGWLGEVADAIGADACALAGMCAEGPPPTDVDRAVLLLELEQVTTKLWNCHAQLPREKVVVHYLDGPTREVALASAFVLLARTMLDKLPDEGSITAEAALSCDLEKAMVEYEMALGPSPAELERQRAEQAGKSVSEQPEPSFHGTGGVD